MKKELKYILWGHLAVILYLVYCTFDLITLLHDDSFSDALLNLELNPGDGTLDRPTIIPKIIHQTYKSTKIPEEWKPGQQACIDLHPDYTYILWTDDKARSFIEREYPWFLKTWDSYPYPIQRADAIRYFALVHYGGVYIDLDDGCERRLDPLLTVPAFVRKTIPTGISNDVMGSVPRHPFFLKVIESLSSYKKNWLVPYITIMYSTGPLFLSVIWKQYKRWGVPEAGKVRILMPEDYKTHLYSFFAIAPGSSWHLDDAKFIKGLANHIVLAVIGGFLIAGFIFYLEYLFYSYVSSKHFKKMTKKVTNGSLFTLIKYKLNKNIKRRARKDSNLPVDFNVLEKLNEEHEDHHSSNPNNSNVYEQIPQQTYTVESGSGDDEFYDEDDTFIAGAPALKNNDNIV
ncbi:glycosyltransferase family 32 protein [Suhomyces tanzawaensis NRRL Y-17324]|uniref:inositol phosphorylceramide mannosyltransferase n=1 Tax=Suhomyces tanzawaensis NRRL Y-17324 TaxID=984487 RepID=A0A1E4SSE4_9ASCO|nr:glycosyltransferase family 32 protein [Suhomyces tanzawaensis NRRL Y-17324]ODV82312.1 glycosyltransferase family 32 protein [Suhomyces tanzawaensis NRRL Y-17324]